MQLDRVLSALNSNARANLQTLLQGLGRSLNGRPTAAQDATQDPSVRGLTAGQSLNKSLNYSADAFKASAIVNAALLGEQPHDLSGVVAGNEQLFSALAAGAEPAGGPGDDVQRDDGRAGRPPAGPVDHDRAAAARSLRAADTALGPLQASFGPTQQFAAAICPGVKQPGADDHRRAAVAGPVRARCSPRRSSAAC